MRLLSLMFVMLSSLHAFALDYKILPGSFCKAKDGSQESLLVREHGTVKNGSSTDVSVVCPVINDVTNETAINRSEITIDFGQYIRSCNMKAASANTISTNNTSLGTTNGPQTFVLMNEVSVGQQSSRYYVDCTLPPQGTIYQYKVGE